MKKIVSIIIAAVAIALGVTSCTYYENPVVPVPTNVTFKANVVPIFNASCNSGAGCHSTGGIQPDLTPDNAYNSLTTFGYVDTAAPTESILYVKVHTGSMAKFTKSSTDAEVILKWIELGALDN